MTITDGPHPQWYLTDGLHPQSYLTNTSPCIRRAPGNKLLGLLTVNYLQQHVIESTRQNNILDIVITTTDPRINGVELENQTRDD
ncbi:hypothetical protein FHG87_021633 [Trinorchestia longiramus]|nr:hypothetical protein FHG87_021633 [Trinorchestia longiramus]